MSFLCDEQEDAGKLCFTAKSSVPSHTLTPRTGTVSETLTSTDSEKTPELMNCDSCHRSWTAVSLFKCPNGDYKECMICWMLRMGPTPITVNLATIWTCPKCGSKVGIDLTTGEEIKTRSPQNKP